MNRLNFEGPCHDYSVLFDPPVNKTRETFLRYLPLGVVVLLTIVAEWWFGVAILFPGAPWL